MARSHKTFRNKISKIAPIVEWLPNYKREWLSFDLTAGMTLAAFTIPEALAYAKLAKLPPEAGLYASILPPILYAIFGASKQLAIGPTAAISVLLASSLGALGLGSPEQYAAYAALTAILVGIISLIAYFLRLGFLVNYISESVLLGFTKGAGIYIASTQLAKLFGLHGAEGHFPDRIVFIVENMGEINIWATCMGLFALALILVGEWKAPRLPWPLITVFGAIGVVHVIGVSDTGVRLMDNIPQGFPEFSAPQAGLSNVPDLLVIAGAVFLLSYLEGMSMASSYASKYGYRIDSNRELLALGFSSFAAGFTQGYPVAGSFSRTALNDESRAKTQLANGIGGIIIGFVVIFFTGIFSGLAEPVLAAVVLVAVRGLFKISRLRTLYRVRRVEFWPAMAALFSVLILGVLEGVIVGSLISLLMVIGRASQPRISVLGKIPGRPQFADINENKDIISIPGLLIVRPEEGMFYVNANALRDKIWEMILKADTPVQALVIDLEMTGDLDLSAAHTIAEMKKELEQRGVVLRLSRVQNSALRLLEASQILGVIGRQNIHPRTLFAVAAYLTEEGVEGRQAHDILPDMVACVRELARNRANKAHGEEREALERISEQLREILKELEELDGLALEKQDH
jgi:high affinity sulfate transporter 1